jgi:D-alanine-D-alanine ligase
MSVNAKTRVAVLYGGRSGEHEVSLVSAASVIRNLDRGLYEIVPIAIDKQGRWLLHDLKTIDLDAKALPVSPSALPVVLPPTPGATSLVSLNGQVKRIPFDVIFPVMHGPLCEDGTLQGLLDLAEVPYVGCGVLASAVGMDKDVAKRLAHAAGIPVVPWITLRRAQYLHDPTKAHEAIASQLGYPNFVKPANMGSSVGVAKVKAPSELASAIADALKYDTKVLVEKAIDAREIEVSVLESLEERDPPMTSVAGEVQPTHEFYSYDAKYIDENGAVLSIPARLDEAQMRRVRQIAADVFTTLECEGLTRADLFLDRTTNQFYFNEVNTLPGFTQISMFPKLWDATGLPYPKLLTHLIELALRRHRRKSALSREYRADE